MDEDLKHLEAELRALQPSEPLPHLVRRIGAELNHEDRVPRAALRWFWAAALPVAAAVALIVGNFSGSQSNPKLKDQAAKVANADPEAIAPPATLKPITAENVLVSARDEGLVTLDDGTQARRERLQYVDTITWKNPRTNASLRWSVPREEVRVVPIAFQ